MPDQLAQRLMRLSPEVDVPAGRELFERSRAGGRRRGPRWLLPAAVVVLVVAGITGIWAVAGNDDEPTSPAAPVDEPPPAVTEGTVTEGEGYEVVLVGQSSREFGHAELVTTAEQLSTLWDEMDPGPDEPTVEFASSVALVMTRPDNACPDTITRFDVAPGATDVPVWTPVLEDLADACDDPLLSWIYVVALDRNALGASATIRIPANDVYGVAEQLLPYEAGAAPAQADDTATADEISPTGVTVAMPPVGEPAIHNTSAGLVWVVAHGDGSASVLPAAIDQPVSEDEGGVTNLQSLVLASSSGRSFAGGASGFVWDSYGRAVNGGRSNDLTGYEGRVDGDEVEIMDSSATRVPGDVDPGLAGDLASEQYPTPDVGEPIDLATFATLSSSGPIWRHLDATLVVENGIGRICELPPDPTFDQLTGCGQSESEFVFDTQVTATDPDITSWFHAPILASQHPVDGFTSVIPMGGMSGRNDAAVE